MAVIRYDWSKATLKFATASGALAAYRHVGGVLSGNKLTIYRRGSSAAWLTQCQHLIAEFAGQ